MPGCRPVWSRELADASGRVVATSSEPLDLASSSTAAVTCHLTVDGPQRWSLDDPNLYTLVVRVCWPRRGAGRDSRLCRLAHRRLQSGQRLVAQRQIPQAQRRLPARRRRGARVRRCRPKSGSADCRRSRRGRQRHPHGAQPAHARALRPVRPAGLSGAGRGVRRVGAAARTSGSPAGTSATPGKDGSARSTSPNGREADLRDMVRRDRNHPSVIMWSIGNEIDYPNDPYTHEALDRGANPQIYGRGLRAGAAPRRPSGRGSPAAGRRRPRGRPDAPGHGGAWRRRSMANETGFADALDVVGYNYQEYRYAEDHARYPDRVMYGSENGMSWDAWQAVAGQPLHLRAVSLDRHRLSRRGARMALAQQRRPDCSTWPGCPSPSTSSGKACGPLSRWPPSPC